MRLARRRAITVFLAFALAYFLSALLRAITATLSPRLTQEFALQARDLGLLAGGFFLGFAVMQLPLGRWLDRHGPKRVILCLLVVAVAGCLAFSVASSFAGLLAARILCGVGVCACLMAPLTGYRRWLDPIALLRANSWMLMTGSLGMVTSTLPVQWLLPVIGWRALFMVLAATILLAMAVIWLAVPAWGSHAAPSPVGASSYREVWRHAYFQRLAPLGFFAYGGLLAIQTLWAGPWMSAVAAQSDLAVATGLFCINLTMLVTFWLWGMVNPWLARHGWATDRLITVGLPASFVLLAFVIAAGPRLAQSTGAWLAAYCLACSFVSLSQPAVGIAFAPALAGRALSAFNLVIFCGVFVVQWGIGLLVDGAMFLGLQRGQAFQAAFSVYLCCCVASYGFFIWFKPHNPTP